MSPDKPKPARDHPAPEVVVIFDPGFGDRLRTIRPDGAVWIVSSPINQPVIKALWSKFRTTDVQTCLTGFDQRPDLRPEEHILDVLSTVDQHHDAHATTAPYRTLNVIGGELTPRIKRELVKLEFDHFSVTSTGFLATRSNEAAAKFRE